ncbi:GrpB family protein [Candidatus Protochlamydia sp. W-9]|uniref:GrpB family protein n=1 Tax=Candidatus Protochlamydia sp. W-9 TaxID=1785087 RepID=UPI0009AEFA14
MTSHVQKLIAIEHIGSTAVLRLGGKGIVDIAIAVNKKDMDAVPKHFKAWDMNLC